MATNIHRLLRADVEEVCSTYDVGARIALASEVERATSETREDFDEIPKEPKLDQVRISTDSDIYFRNYTTHEIFSHLVFVSDCSQ